MVRLTCLSPSHHKVFSKVLVIYSIAITILLLITFWRICKCIESRPQGSAFWLEAIREYENKNISSKVDVVISLTTSPVRFRSTLNLLQKLLKDGCIPQRAEVHLNLPAVYGRTNQTFPADLNLHPFPHEHRLSIFHGLRDDGPMTKLLPTLDRVHARGIKALTTVVVTIDDDIYYWPGLLHAHVLLQESLPTKAVTVLSALDAFADESSWPEGNPIGSEFLFNLVSKHAIFSQKSLSAHGRPPSIVPWRPAGFIEGYGSVGYPVAFINRELLRKFLGNGGQICKQSDDMLVSLALMVQPTPVASIDFASIDSDRPITVLDYGLKEDALHNVQTHLDMYMYCGLKLFYDLGLNLPP